MELCQSECVNIRNFIEKEVVVVKRKLHLDPLEERTWLCEPLVVVNASGEIVYEGKTNVDVTPHADGTADMIAETDREGWQPQLMNAKYSVHSSSNMFLDGSRDGVDCLGLDQERQGYIWYINGAADDYFADIVKSAKLKSPENEVPLDQ